MFGQSSRFDCSDITFFGCPVTQFVALLRVLLVELLLMRVAVNVHAHELLMFFFLPSLFSRENIFNKYFMTLVICVI